jgi:predicted RNase H-like HicB family nuclease
MDKNMAKIKYKFWQDEKIWLGHLEEYPNYMTQGETIKELENNLKDIYKDLTGGLIPAIKKVAELEVF